MLPFSRLAELRGPFEDVILFNDWTICVHKTKQNFVLENGLKTKISAAISYFHSQLLFFFNILICTYCKKTPNETTALKSILHFVSNNIGAGI